MIITIIFTLTFPPLHAQHHLTSVSFNAKFGTVLDENYEEY